MCYRKNSYGATVFDRYFFEKDLFGNIVAVYNDSGTKVASYCYDAWGNCTVLTNVNGIGAMNPFRYRGYYLDTETNLYYLQSRYYDSYVGRFINADGQLNGGLLGYNLFAYCENNPVMYIDPTGELFREIFDQILNYILFCFALASDIMNFDPNNEDEEKVLQSYFFSCYKGTLVIRTNFDRSGTFGIIFLSRYVSNTPEDDVRHEYGHIVQMRELGVLKYTIYIAIPSALKLGNKLYYDKPWEISADLNGGVVSRVHSAEDIQDGWSYMRYHKHNNLLNWIMNQWGV